MNNEKYLAELSIRHSLAILLQQLKHYLDSRKDMPINLDIVAIHVDQAVALSKSLAVIKDNKMEEECNHSTTYSFSVEDKYLSATKVFTPLMDLITVCVKDQDGQVNEFILTMEQADWLGRLLTHARWAEE